MRCVIDANILIDLNQGGVLRHFFGLPIQIVAPAFVLVEMFEPDGKALLELGVKQVDFTSDQLFEATQMNAANTQLSLSDCAAFILAREEKINLLTGDQRLRRRAEKAGIEVHGVLWVLDQIESAGQMAGPALAASLKKMLAEGARLPADECAKRFAQWEGTI